MNISQSPWLYENNKSNNETITFFFLIRIEFFQDCETISQRSNNSSIPAAEIQFAAWIGNYIHYEAWDEIINSFPNFKV